MSAMSDLDAAIRAVAEQDDKYGPTQTRTREDLLAAVNVPTAETWTRFGLGVYARYWQYRTDLADANTREEA